MIAPEYLKHFNKINITSAVLISSVSKVFLITGVDTNNSKVFYLRTALLSTVLETRGNIINVIHS